MERKLNLINMKNKTLSEQQEKKITVSLDSKLVLKKILKLIDYDWRDSCSPICAVTHPIERNPHLTDLRKDIIRLFKNL